MADRLRGHFRHHEVILITPAGMNLDSLNLETERISNIDVEDIDRNTVDMRPHIEFHCR